jgi:gamma-glutamylcysteine synthetase
MMLRQQRMISRYGSDLQVIRGIAYAFPMSGMLWSLLALSLLLLLG